MHHVLLVERRILQHKPEEVWLRHQRLVCDHHRSFLHHSLFDLRRDFVQLLVEVFVARQIPQLRWDVPEANISAFRLRDELETFTTSHDRCEVLRHLEDRVDVFLESFGALGTPHIPELVDISTTTALDVFVTGVVLCVVELILLEQISGIGRVARRQNAVVTAKECGALLWNCEQLVWIPCD